MRLLLSAVVIGKIALAVAGAAVPGTSSDLGVFRGVFVAVGAVGDSRLSRQVSDPRGREAIRDGSRSSADAPRQSLFVRPRFQVCWIHATSRAAQLDEHETFRNWSDKNFIADAVRLSKTGGPQPLVSSRDDRVAKLHSGQPEPASRVRFGRDLFEQSLDERPGCVDPHSSLDFPSGSQPNQPKRSTKCPSST